MKTRNCCYQKQVWVIQWLQLYRYKFLSSTEFDAPSQARVVDRYKFGLPTKAYLRLLVETRIMPVLDWCWYGAQFRRDISVTFLSRLPMVWERQVSGVLSLNGLFTRAQTHCGSFEARRGKSGISILIVETHCFSGQAVHIGRLAM